MRRSPHFVKTYISAFGSRTMGLEIVEIVLFVESEFGIELSNEDGNVRTFGDLINSVERQFREKRPSHPLTTEQIASFLRVHLFLSYNLDPRLVMWDADLVTDLGLG